MKMTRWLLASFLVFSCFPGSTAWAECDGEVVRLLGKMDFSFRRFLPMDETGRERDSSFVVPVKEDDRTPFRWPVVIELLDIDREQFQNLMQEGNPVSTRMLYYVFNWKSEYERVSDNDLADRESRTSEGTISMDEFNLTVNIPMDLLQLRHMIGRYLDELEAQGVEFSAFDLQGLEELPEGKREFVFTAPYHVIGKDPQICFFGGVDTWSQEVVDCVPEQVTVTNTPYPYDTVVYRPKRIRVEMSDTLWLFAPDQGNFKPVPSPKPFQFCTDRSGQPTLLCGHTQLTGIVFQTYDCE